MTGPERGFLLLTSSLGDPQRKPLTVAQFRDLAKRALDARRDVSSRDLEAEDLMAMGYDRPMAERIYGLLSQTNCLREYLRRASACGCYPVTRLSADYPLAVRRRLGLDSPGVLWAKGDLSLLNRPAVAVIGSRDLRKANRSFARKAGHRIAKQGWVLVSGNARGADKTAQDACLEAGGAVISILADRLETHTAAENILYLSLDDFDRDFSLQRALRRNHVIHAMGALTVAAQCTLGKGGTWEGILANLKQGWNPVYIFDDGSDAVAELRNRGVQPVTQDRLEELALLAEGSPSFLHSI